MQDTSVKKWYQKKRYILPIVVFAIATIAGLSSPDPVPTSLQNTQTTNSQVKGEKIVLPKTFEPLEVIEPQSSQDEKVDEVPTSNPVPAPTPTETPSFYKNSYGNEVQSPTYYNSAPAGASARCRDGTYSFSQNRRGTCSHHGGVAEWY